MIRKASEDYPDCKWILFDAGKDEMTDTFDIVFSNATIQWIPDHAGLIKKFSDMLNEGGMLAVQLPLFFDMPLGRAIHEIAQEDGWSDLMSSIRGMFTIHNIPFYYDELSKHFREINIWTTDYYHVMGSHQSILEMIRSTGLRPYLDRLTDETEKTRFEALVLERIENDYPFRADGRVLFPFERLWNIKPITPFDLRVLDQSLTCLTLT